MFARSIEEEKGSMEHASKKDTERKVEAGGGWRRRQKEPRDGAKRFQEQKRQRSAAEGRTCKGQSEYFFLFQLSVCLSLCTTCPSYFPFSALYGYMSVFHPAAQRQCSLSTIPSVSLLHCALSVSLFLSFPSSCRFTLRKCFPCFS